MRGRLDCGSICGNTQLRLVTGGALLFPVGQPSLAGIAPFCVGAVPPPVLAAAGNPGLAIMSVSPPPATPGMPTALLFIPVAAGVEQRALGRVAVAPSAPRFLVVGLEAGR